MRTSVNFRKINFRPGDRCVRPREAAILGRLGYQLRLERATIAVVGAARLEADAQQIRNVLDPSRPAQSVLGPLSWRIVSWGFIFLFLKDCSALIARGSRFALATVAGLRRLSLLARQRSLNGQLRNPLVEVDRQWQAAPVCRVSSWHRAAAGHPHEGT